MIYLIITIFIGIFLAIFTTVIDRLKFKRLENRLEDSFSKLNKLTIQTLQDDLIRYHKHTSKQIRSLILILETSGYKSSRDKIERDINSFSHIYPDFNEFKYKLSSSYGRKKSKKRNGSLDLQKNILTCFDSPATYEFS